MSISKVQAEALAEGFLDNLGSSKDELSPKSSLTEIILLAGELIEDAQNNLNQSHSVASGNLSESLVAENPEVNGKKFSIDVVMNFYGRFVNKGVKGTKSGSSTAGYSFKNDFAPKVMAEAIQKWIKRSSLQIRNIKNPVSKIEKKRKGISGLNLGRKVAYATARSIKQHGIKKTGFLDKAVTSTELKVRDRMGKALEIDVINSIPKKI